MIDNIEVVDLRVPTSDKLLGSDAIHKKPNYSAALVSLRTSAGLEGKSVVFTLGAGTDWIAYGIRDLATLVVGTTLDEFIADPGAAQRRLVEHHQLRWLGDGLYRMAVGGIINALWDLWAKREEKPLWKLLADLAPEKVVQCVDWTHLRDLFTPEEAIELLQARREGRQDREQQMLKRGAKAYSTAGWLGLTGEQIKQTADTLKAQGFDSFKMKVGGGVQTDCYRLSSFRKVIGDESHLMLDANQRWGVAEAIEYMDELAQFHPVWIEEPTARDDVIAYLEIAQALKKYNIGVAGGEQFASPVMFKQTLRGAALGYCQIDAVRLAGVNDVIAVILMAAKEGVPVCPHGGGIGLCNMIQHYAIWDQVCVAGHSDNQVAEYLDFLQDGVFVEPVRVQDGAYVVPARPGWGLDMHEAFIEAHRYPEGSVWAGREASGGAAFVA